MSFYEQAGSSAASVDHRRKWDPEEYEKKAAERIKEEKLEEAIKRGDKPKNEPKVKREMLKARDYKVDLESKLGRSVVINKTTPAAETGGYYCDVCDCVVKDSINFLDHINGKNHQRNMGMSMKVKRSTLEDVKERFKLKMAEKEYEKKQKNLEDMLGDVYEEEARMNDYKKEKKAEQRKRKLVEAAPEEDDIDPDLKAMMGFGGFGGMKKK
ncbi:unnamed protein product [Nippostrongylus brasiliensis]|uniref:Zinc finger matrin-type protein 2 (inferred by orthology to a human protein) n=1 Tax=Nippostrongylus brasiliensis TaxID=27835 RepID=A0A0N4YA27_NIPBR|nr:hypothetical protein Q1695_014964 [Nippostrongylus brasiliensis]VDL76800.1 unnamed protein product [Nippostrongylus brasiliensis]